MWRIWPTDEFERRFKKFNKKKKGQLDAVLKNLDRFLSLLRLGKKPKPLPFGFLRDEGLGILRISESGAEANVAATRLYVYPDSDTETLYLLTIGDKSTQSEDIKLCKTFTKQIQADPSLGETQDDDDNDEEEAGDGEGEEGQDLEDG